MPTPNITIHGPIGIRDNGQTPNLFTIPVDGATSGSQLIAQIVAYLDAQAAPLQPQLDAINAAKSAIQS